MNHTLLEVLLAVIRAQLEMVLRFPWPDTQTINLTIGPPILKSNPRETPKMVYNTTVDFEHDLGFGPAKDRAGNDVAIAFEGVPTWSSSDEAVCTVTPSEDGLTARLSTVDNGVAVITVTGDADLGEGVRTLVGTLEVNVGAGIAQSFELVVTSSLPR